MKTFALVLTATLLIVAGTPRLKRAVSPQCENPGAWYASYNETYFQNSLPKDTIVDYANHSDGVLAVTTFENSRFRISFNPAYAASAPVVHLFLLHEDCHVKTWNEDAEHGPEWIACMRDLEHQGAIDDQMVKVYAEPPFTGPKEN